MKILKWICGIIVTLAVVGCVLFFVDKNRVENGKAPKFAIKKLDKNEKKATYLGLGYKVIAYFDEDGKEDFKNNKSYKIGSWFMNFKMKPEQKEVENKEENVKIESVEDLYNYVKKEGKEFKKANEDFSKDEAKEQDFYVITNEGENLNKEILDEFFEKYDDEKFASIRIAKETEEGKIYIFDLVFEPKTKKVYLVADKTRDDKLDKDETKIKLEAYDKAEKVKDEDKENLVVFEGTEYDKDSEAKKSMIIGEIK